MDFYIPGTITGLQRGCTKLPTN